MYFPSIMREMRAVLDGQGNQAPPADQAQSKMRWRVNMPDVFHPVNTWLEKKETTGLWREMKEAGIGQAWIGLNSWEQAYVKPELARQAGKAGASPGGLRFLSFDSWSRERSSGSPQSFQIRAFIKTCGCDRRGSR